MAGFIPARIGRNITSKAVSGLFVHLMLQMEARPVLIVGAGPVAARKAAALLVGGAEITLLAPSRAEELWRELPCRWLPQEYTADFPLAEYQLVVAATDNAALNAEIAARCAGLGLACNCASRPQLGTVVLPGVVQAGGFSAALFSGGRAPFLTKRLKRELAAWLAEYDEPTLEWLGELRRRIIEAGPSAKQELLAALGAVPLPRLKQKMQEIADTGGQYETEDIIYWLQREQAGAGSDGAGGQAD
jgi:siroheme synthase-like protein